MFSENLKKIRKEKGLSQEALSEKLNIVRQTISKWEKGLSIPDGDMLIKLSQVLEILFPLKTIEKVCITEKPEKRGLRFSLHV